MCVCVCGGGGGGGGGGSSMRGVCKGEGVACEVCVVYVGGGSSVTVWGGGEHVRCVCGGERE